MSLTDSKWTRFQIDAEEDTYGLDQLVDAHNEIYGKMVYAQGAQCKAGARVLELEKALDAEMHEHAEKVDEMIKLQKHVIAKCLCPTCFGALDWVLDWGLICSECGSDWVDTARYKEQGE